MNESVDELVSAIIGKPVTGVPTYGALGIAEMAERYGGLAGKRLTAALKLAQHLNAAGDLERPVLRSPRDTFKHLEPMGRLNREQFRVLYLNTANRIIRDEIISIGSLNASLVHPREVFRPGIECSCASMIIAHNHPGGSLEPSREDIQLTRQLLAVSRVMSIPILDHLIIGHAGFFSFQEHGMMTEA